jgi:AraC family transcriptional regulator of adaptative response/methylated-DNA-[protein]-cysteine methyltransferase
MAISTETVAPMRPLAKPGRAKPGRAGTTSGTTSKVTDNGRQQASAKQLATVRAVCALIDEREGEPVTLAELAEAVGMSPWHLQRLFRKVMGVSPRDYADARRSRRFRDRLRDGESIAGATYESGYGSSSRVYERAQHHLGMTPASYAKGGKGARITYAMVDSPLGRLLVAATGKGVCFVSLGDDDAQLEAALYAEFPEADSIVRDHEASASAVDAFMKFLEGEAPHVDLPLDIRFTAFQRRVWNELMAIPCGEIRSYAEIAAALDLPHGQRAIGRACASNPVALIVPCHRVLRHDGELGGYRWGLRRKSALLTKEAERV